MPVQSAATSPYYGFTNERLSRSAVSLRLRDEGKHGFDLAGGVADLRLLGVRYYLAADPETQAAADASAQLRPVASTEPYEGMRWKVYELPDVHIVESLPFQPVVVEEIDQGRAGWERAMTKWYDSGAEREVPLVVDGPRAWPRVDKPPPRSPRVASPPTAVTNVRIDHHRISFEVADTGRPVMVKVSYFPNWKAQGADGPWRASPNFMVVVPRSNTVVRRFARTLPDYAGIMATLAGAGAAAWVARRPPLDVPVPVDAEPPPANVRPKPGRTKSKGKRKNRR
jgi:hypothetical protein